MVSLADQLMKAGLVDKKKATKVQQDKSKQKKDDRRSGTQTVDEVALAAQEKQRQQAERARELNAQRDAVAAQKAVMAQIVQLVQINRQNKGKGDIAYNYTHGSKVERMYVSAAVRDHLVAGRLAIICMEPTAELVPRVIAEKIAERNAALVVQVKKTDDAPDVDDPYSDYKIPDDFDW